MCVNCGELEHGDCNKAPQCFNCKENHPASDRKCQRYVFEKEVLTIKTKENLSFREARSQARLRMNLMENSFAKILKNTSKLENKKDTSITENKRVVGRDLLSSSNNSMKRTLSKESILQPPSKVPLSEVTVKAVNSHSSVPALAGTSSSAEPLPFASAKALASASPEALPSASPETLVCASPEALVCVSPEAFPSASPEALPSASPEALPSASPEALPSASPEALPSASLEALASASSEASARAYLGALPSPSPPASSEANPPKSTKTLPSVDIDPSCRKESVEKMEVSSASPSRKQVKKGASAPKSSKVNSKVLLTPRPASSGKNKKDPKKLSRDHDHKGPKSK